MSPLPQRSELYAERSAREFLAKKLGPYEHPLSRLVVLNWINTLMYEEGGKKVGRINGYKDQWLIKAYYDEGDQTINLGFCQGRNVGRIVTSGGFDIDLEIKDCSTIEEIDFKFEYIQTNKEEDRRTVKDLAAKLVQAIKDKDDENLRACVRRFHWMGLEVEKIPGGSKMSDAQEIQVMKEKVEIALKNGATPSLKLCEQLRETDPESAKWLDQIYLQYKRPELVGDDKDGLCALLKSEGYLRKALEECKNGDELIYWFRIVKGLDPLPDAIKEKLAGKQESA
jgi:hypothetical protein